tara:strand:+ start:114 stop:464 length:351 start_codon:yes stop_codon:yes gene_type:complete
MSDPIANDPIAQQLYTTARGWIRGQTTVGPANIMSFATMLMIAVQKLAKGRGVYKKELVLTVMRAAIENDVPFDNDEDKQAVLQLVDTVVPAAIDGIKDIGTQLMTNPPNCFPCCK